MPSQEDILMAHRYLYYVLAKPVISDYTYDMMEREFLLTAPESSPMQLPGSDCVSSYSKAIIALAESFS